MLHDPHQAEVAVNLAAIAFFVMLAIAEVCGGTMAHVATTSVNPLPPHPLFVFNVFFLSASVPFTLILFHCHCSGMAVIKAFESFNLFINGGDY